MPDEINVEALGHAPSCIQTLIFLLNAGCLWKLAAQAIRMVETARAEVAAHTVRCADFCTTTPKDFHAPTETGKPAAQVTMDIDEAILQAKVFR